MPMPSKQHSRTLLTPVSKEAILPVAVPLSPRAKSPPLPAATGDSAGEGAGSRARSLSEELEARVLKTPLSPDPTLTTNTTAVELSPPMKASPAVSTTPKACFIESPVSVTGSGSSTEDSPPASNRGALWTAEKNSDRRDDNHKAAGGNAEEETRGSDDDDDDDALIPELVDAAHDIVESVDEVLCSLLALALQQEESFLADSVATSPQVRKINVELSTGCADDFAAIEKETAMMALASATKRYDLASTACERYRNSHAQSVSKGLREVEYLRLLDGEVASVVKQVTKEHGGGVLEAMKGVQLLRLEEEDFEGSCKGDGHDVDDDDMTTY
jgi:hypothetical protein